MSARGAHGLALTIATLALPALTGGCGAPAPMTTPPQVLSVRQVNWNPGNVSVGNATAVAEVDNVVAVFSDTGATVLVGCNVAATDTSVRAWTGATTIPAADGTGTWLVGVGADGHVRRLRARSVLEDVSDRYGLAMDHVTSTANLGNGYIGFGYMGGIAVANMSQMQVSRYDDGSFEGLAGGGGRAAGASAGMVRVFEPNTGHRVSFPLAGVSRVVFDARGRLVAATDHGVYMEDATGALDLRYASDDAVHGLAAAGPRVWFAAGSELGTIENDTVSRSNGAHIPTDASLIGSPSGEVWTLSRGALSRYAPGSAGTGGAAQWEALIRPVFDCTCAACHLPGGSANVDLSTYEAWRARRPLINQRVLVARDMPPPGVMFTDADRAAIQMWLASP